MQRDCSANVYTYLLMSSFNSTGYDVISLMKPGGLYVYKYTVLNT